MPITPSDAYPRIYAVCPGCTLMVVKLAYRRHPWFRIFRVPLWLGMWLLSWWHGFDPDDYLLRNRACYGCLRFRKNILSERSRLFCLLNGCIAGPFGQMLGRLTEGLDPEEKKRFARESTYHSLEEAVADLRRELDAEHHADRGERI